MKAKNMKRTVRTSSRKVTINNTAKGITSQAGMIPVVKFLLNIGLISLIGNTVTHRRGDNALYDAADAIFLTVTGIIAGADSLLGVTVVWADSVLRRLAGWISIPHNSTFGRIFETFRQPLISEMETLNHRLRGKIWRKALRSGKSTIGIRQCMIVDVDSTEKTAYGKQEGVKKGYNPFKRGKACYNPLLAFCAETKEILMGWLRSGDTYTGNGVVEFMKQLLAHLPNKTRVLFRGDRGFFNGKLMDLLDHNGHGYLIKVKLKGLVKLLARKEWTEVPKQPGWEQCVFWYKCAEWSTERRFIAVRREKEQEQDSDKKQLVLSDEKQYDYFCYVTTEELTGWEAHKSYGKRATCETWIEEAKNHTALGHIKTNDFWASSALFQCAIIAYNTLRWMALCSGDEELRRWEPATIRTFLIRVGGKMTTGANQLCLNTPADKLYPTQWDAWVQVGIT